MSAFLELAEKLYRSIYVAKDRWCSHCGKLLTIKRQVEGCLCRRNWKHGA